MKNLFTYIILICSLINKLQAQVPMGEQCIGGNGHDEVIDTKYTNDEGLLAIIHTTSNDRDFPDNHGGQDIGLVKLNKNRQIEWKLCIGDTLGDDLYKACTVYKDRFYIQSVSKREGYDSLSSTYYFMAQSMLTAIDNSGNIIWQINYPVRQVCYDYTQSKLDIDTLTDDLYISYANGDTTFLEKYTANGNNLWKRSCDFTSYLWSDWCEENNNFSVIPLKNKQIFIYTMLNQDQGVLIGKYLKRIFSLIDSNGTEILRNDTYFPIDSFYWYSLYPFPYLNLNNDTIGLWIWGKGYTRINLNDLSVLSVWSDSAFIAQSGLGEPALTPVYDYTNEVTPYNYDYVSYTFDNNLSELFKDSLILYDGYVDGSNTTPLFFYNYFTGHFDSVTVNIDHNNDQRSLFYYLPSDTSILFTTAGNSGNKNLIKVKTNGQLVYDRSIWDLHDENVVAYPEYTPGSTFKRVVDNKWYDLSQVYDYNIEVYNYQLIQVINTDNGDVLFEYINNMNDTLTFKHISSLNDNQLFSIADLNGINKCQLGDWDVLFFNTLIYGNKVVARAFIDYNNNQIKDINDPYYVFGFLESTKGPVSFSTYLSAFSYTTNIVDTGIWVSGFLPDLNYFNISPASFATDHSDYGNSDTVLFALYPFKTLQDLKISLINPFITRLGNTASYEMTCSNAGTHPANGSVKLILDDRFIYQSSTPAISSMNGDTLVWDFTNFTAGSSSKITVNFQVPVPPDLNAGDTVHSRAIIEPILNDSTPNDNIATLNEVIRAAYDPNDKNTTSGKDITPAQIANDEYITYVVRFQNTGNDTAFRVVIEDTLDSKLDWASLQPAGGSHPFTMQVINKNIIQFTFSNLKLPPASINEEKSHGYVAYKIKVKKDVSVGNTIKNTAHIYFDFNTPIATQTVSTRVITLTAINDHVVRANDIKIYPNPNNGQFSLQLDIPSTLLNIQMIDLTGKVVYQKEFSGNEASIDVRGLAAGIYSLQVRTNKGLLTQKILIE